MFIKSTKKFDRMPCAHAQFQDTKTGKIDFSGHCAGLHGYSRSVILEFSGLPDEYGWIVPFGDLKAVRNWLEYYYDHTSIVPSNDPRLERYMEMDREKLIDLRALPYGVSMEMSSLFIWEHVNPYIMKKTNNRCFVSKVQVVEHEPNSGLLEVTHKEAIKNLEHNMSHFIPELPQIKIWKWKSHLESAIQFDM